MRIDQHTSPARHRGVHRWTLASQFVGSVPGSPHPGPWRRHQYQSRRGLSRPARDSTNPRGGATMARPAQRSP